MPTAAIRFREPLLREARGRRLSREALFENAGAKCPLESTLRRPGSQNALSRGLFEAGRSEISSRERVGEARIAKMPSREGLFENRWGKTSPRVRFSELRL